MELPGSTDLLLYDVLQRKGYRLQRPWVYLATDMYGIGDCWYCLWANRLLGQSVIAAPAVCDHIFGY
jgi:hypothetical protein